MAIDSSFFLKISGTIHTSKQREFEQTIQFVFNHLPVGCIDHNLSNDVHTPELYHLYSLWDSESSLYAFGSSNEFQLIKGAFQTLGSYRDTMTGRKNDIQLFELKHLDS